METMEVERNTMNVKVKKSVHSRLLNRGIVRMNIGDVVEMEDDFYEKYHKYQDQIDKLIASGDIK